MRERLLAHESLKPLIDQYRAGVTTEQWEAAGYGEAEGVTCITASRGEGWADYTDGISNR